jgi:hypothetical protein
VVTSDVPIAGSALVFTTDLSELIAAGPELLKSGTAKSA